MPNMVLKCQYLPHRNTTSQIIPPNVNLILTNTTQIGIRKHKTHKYKSQYSTKPHKKEIKCIKCGKIGHIAPNCRRQKINVLSNPDKDYYSEENTSSSSDISQNENLILEKEKSSTDKIENCLYQLNMLIADKELLIEMIDQIGDKEAKAKYISKIMEQNIKVKNSLPISNAYRFKDIMQQFEVHDPVTTQDLQLEIKKIKTQIEELKTFTQNLDFKIQNIETQRVSLTPQTSKDLDNFVNSMTIVQKQRWYTKITLKINPGFQSTFIALIDLGADLNCIQEGLIPTVYDGV